MSLKKTQIRIGNKIENKLHTLCVTNKIYFQKNLFIFDSIIWSRKNKTLIKHFVRL